MARMMKRVLRMMGTGMGRKLMRKRRRLVMQRRHISWWSRAEIRLLMTRRSLNSTLPWVQHLQSQEWRWQVLQLCRMDQAI